MGKTRKSKKESCQSYHAVSEDENCFQETETDFMTSDNFCVVQKRKHSRKIGDHQNEVSQLPRSRSNSKSFSDMCASSEDGQSNHTGFWKRKFDKIVPEMAEQNSDFCKAGEENEKFTCSSSPCNSEFKLPGMKDLTTNVESSVTFSGAMTDDSDSNEMSQSFTPCKISNLEADFLEYVSTNNLLLEDKSQEIILKKCIKSETTEHNAKDGILSEHASNNSGKVSKKKSKKGLKSKLDDELDKLLKELGIEDKQTCQKNPVKSFPPTETLKKSVVSTSNKKRKKQNSTISNGNESCVCDNIVIDLKESSSDSVSSELKTVVNGNNLENHVVESHNKKKKVKPGKVKQKVLDECNDANYEKTEISQEKILDKDDDDVPNSKKPSKKSSKDEETEKRDKKRPGKKQLAVIQEALKKAKEEEERLKCEELVKQRAAEEAEKARLEKLRLELEKKEKKKLKEKQRRERMKAEGRLLSKSQKQSRARMEATLAAFRQQGINIPQAGEKRPHGPRLGNDKTLHRRRLDSTQSNQGIDAQISSTERKKSESLSSQESGKYSLSDFPSSFDSKDSWEFSSMEGSSALTAESGHLSCSEESDILDMDEASDSRSLGKEINTKTNQIEKSNIANNPSALNAISKNDKTKSVKLRSPVVCVLGHVDTGKTKILDFIRKTHVQDSEAGGITQQIGATMIPQDALKEKCKMVQNFSSLDLKIPGLLVIDTPGHKSFSNLRVRGSSICDIAILVVDIMHGLEPQTIESINLLKAGKTPFIVALNKVDRIYGWKSSKDSDIRKTIDSQSQATLTEFNKRCQNIILQFANECLNAALFYENNDPRSYVSMVPTSAISGDGMGNILGLIVQLTQSMLHKKLVFSNELQATVLEVKVISGLGTTIDVILVNGCLHESDTIVLAGHDGPIVTQIRSLLMPQPLKELRVKNPYKEYKLVEGAQGVKISGRDLDKAIAGLPLYVAENNSKVDLIKNELNLLFREFMNCIKTSERGVYVQASTLGSLEALLEFLKSSDIPYFAVKIGPVVKKDVTKASIMLEHDNQYACILAFDVKIERDAQELADTLGVRIFHADIIYHLLDMYSQHRDELRMKKIDEIKRSAVFPCKLKILPDFIFSCRDPIVIGVSVEAGILKEGTPLCVPSRDIVEIGLVTSIKINQKPVNSAKKGEEVCIKIEPKQGESSKTYGKHFDCDDVLVSRITRPSIDICKEYYREELHPADWQLMVELKKMLYIM